jgi:hypothetical protein
LRDPVERYASGLGHAVRLAGARRIPVAPGTVIEHAARSDYLPQLEMLLQSFPAEQLLVLQFERCVEEPVPELARTPVIDVRQWPNFSHLT